MNQFNFLLQSFGLQNLKPKFYQPGRELEVKKEGEYNDASVRKITDIDYTMTTGASDQPVLSMLGTPVFCDVVLETQNGGVKLQLLDVLLIVDMQKNIVKTTIQGRSGTVKEYISEGDYNVRLMGRLTEPFSLAYPKSQMAEMISLVRAAEALKVTCEFLQMFGVFELVVESYNFPQREGFQNQQLFDLGCVSDEPIQLQRRRK